MVENEATISWQAPEYPYHEKSHRWFIGAAIILTVLVLYGLFTDGWTFSLAIVVFAGTYYLLHRQVPQVVEMKITSAGVQVGRHSFPHTTIQGFWILNEPPVKRLYLRMFGRMKPDLMIELADSDPTQVRNLLAKHIKEMKGVQEPFADSLIRLLKL